MDQQTAAPQSGLATAIRISTIVLAVCVLIQGWLGSTGFFQGEPNRIDVHGMLGNFMFLVALIQVGIAFYGMPPKIVSRNVVILSVVTVLLVVAQIGLGYSTRDSIDALAWHLPNGVLLMAVTTVTAVLAWNPPASGSQEA